jgi:hypothetical protein
MPILRLLQGSPYDALAIGIMTVAHLEALRICGLTDGASPEAESIAKRVISKFADGETDANEIAAGRCGGIQAVWLGKPLSAAMRNGRGTESLTRYERLPLIALNLVLIWVPSEVSAPIITTAISPAMRPYSMAVAPDSSRRNELKSSFMSASNGLQTRLHARRTGND